MSLLSVTKGTAAIMVALLLTSVLFAGMGPASDSDVIYVEPDMPEYYGPRVNNDGGTRSDDNTTTNDTAPVDNGTATNDTAPVDNGTATNDTAPVDNGTATNDTAPVDNGTATNDTAPVDNGTATNDTAPVDNGTATSPTTLADILDDTFLEEGYRFEYTTPPMEDGDGLTYTSQTNTMVATISDVTSDTIVIHTEQVQDLVGTIEDISGTEPFRIQFHSSAIEIYERDTMDLIHIDEVSFQNTTMGSGLDEMVMLSLTDTVVTYPTGFVNFPTVFDVNVTETITTQEVFDQAVEEYYFYMGDPPEFHFEDSSSYYGDDDIVYDVQYQGHQTSVSIAGSDMETYIFTLDGTPITFSPTIQWWTTLNGDSDLVSFDLTAGSYDPINHGTFDVNTLYLDAVDDAQDMGDVDPGDDPDDDPVVEPPYDPFPDWGFGFFLVPEYEFGMSWDAHMVLSPDRFGMGPSKNLRSFDCDIEYTVLLERTVDSIAVYELEIGGLFEVFEEDQPVGEGELYGTRLVTVDGLSVVSEDILFVGFTYEDAGASDFFIWMNTSYEDPLQLLQFPLTSGHEWTYESTQTITVEGFMEPFGTLDQEKSIPIMFDALVGDMGFEGDETIMEVEYTYMQGLETAVRGYGSMAGAFVDQGTDDDRHTWDLTGFEYDPEHVPLDIPSLETFLEETIGSQGIQSCLINHVLNLTGYEKAEAPYLLYVVDWFIREWVTIFDLWDELHELEMSICEEAGLVDDNDGTDDGGDDDDGILPDFPDLDLGGDGTDDGSGDDDDDGIFDGWPPSWGDTEDGQDPASTRRYP